jgi:DNA-binding protein H-NS
MTQGQNRIEQIDKEIKEFQEKIKELQEEKEAILKEEKRAVIAEIKEKMTTHQITPDELGSEKEKSKTRKAKTATTIAKIKPGRTFSNGTETWTSGKRGKRPLWVSQRIKAGTLDECEVK